MNDDTISRAAAIEAVYKNDHYTTIKQRLDDLPSVQPLVKDSPSLVKDLVKDCISRQKAIDRINKQREHLQPDIYPQDKIGDAAYRICAEFIERLPSVQPEIIHCCDCIYYDPEHIEKNGVRYEYKDMPKAAFVLETGLVKSEYGINVGGKCCRDYNVGYSEDKRVFVSKQNYCGRARRRQDE